MLNAWDFPHDLTVAGNLIEAALWAGFAVAFGLMAVRQAGRRRRLWTILAVAFAAFGVSDVVESRTGAWWRPPGLLVLKGACLAVFAYGIYEYRLINRIDPSGADEPGRVPSPPPGSTAEK